MTTSSRQGRIAGWLKMNQSSVKELAGHLSLSVAHTSRLCNAGEVPTDVLLSMKSFVTPTGKHIPLNLLPSGRDKKPGPAPGWLDRKLAEARQAASSDAA
nr:hypothetical protein [Pseudodesulfovibrio sp.]